MKLFYASPKSSQKNVSQMCKIFVEQKMFMKKKGIYWLCEISPNPKYRSSAIGQMMDEKENPEEDPN